MFIVKSLCFCNALLKEMPFLFRFQLFFCSLENEYLRSIVCNEYNKYLVHSIIYLQRRNDLPWWGEGSVFRHYLFKYLIYFQNLFICQCKVRLLTYSRLLARPWRLQTHTSKVQWKSVSCLPNGTMKVVFCFRH